MTGKKRRAPVRKPASARRSRVKRASDIVAQLDTAPAKLESREELHQPETQLKKEEPALDAGSFTPKEARFVQEYILDLNGAAAARRAGYSEATAKSIACELLAKPRIQDAIEKEMAARVERTKIDADRVLTGIAELAFYDIADLFTASGALRPIHEIPPATRMAIAGIEVSELTLGEVAIGHLKKVKLADRRGNLELLGRHQKLFTDKVEHSASASLEDILTASREGK